MKTDGTAKTVDDWIAEALQKPTLAEALAHVAMYENERAVAQALKGERGPDGQLWDTCFRHLFDRLLSAWTTRNNIAIDLIPRSVPGMNAVLSDREVRSRLSRDNTIGPTIDLIKSYPIACPVCDGTGVVEDSLEGAGYGGCAFVTCERCDGKRVLP